MREGRSATVRLREENDDVVPVNATKDLARLLVQNVGVDLLALDQRDAALPLEALDLQRVTLQAKLSPVMLFPNSSCPAALMD